MKKKMLIIIKDFFNHLVKKIKQIHATFASFSSLFIFNGSTEKEREERIIQIKLLLHISLKILKYFILIVAHNFHSSPSNNTT